MVSATDVSSLRFILSEISISLYARAAFSTSLTPNPAPLPILPPGSTSRPPPNPSAANRTLIQPSEEHVVLSGQHAPPAPAAHSLVPPGQDGAAQALSMASVQGASRANQREEPRPQQETPELVCSEAKQDVPTGQHTVYTAEREGFISKIERHPLSSPPSPSRPLPYHPRPRNSPAARTSHSRPVCRPRTANTAAGTGTTFFRPGPSSARLRSGRRPWRRAGSRRCPARQPRGGRPRRRRRRRRGRTCARRAATTSAGGASTGSTARACARGRRPAGEGGASGLPSGQGLVGRRAA